MIEPSNVAPFPLPLPASLKSYDDMFQRAPREAVRRLEAQSKKRGNDAVCSLLLAWFHHQLGDGTLAREQVARARSFAPGSLFMEFASYRLFHPDGFEAWLPDDPQMGHAPGFFVERTLSLDELIERLSDSDAARITLSETPPDVDADLSQSPFAAEEMATETLAAIYEKQGKLDEAAVVYERLLKAHPDREAHFRERLNHIRRVADA